MDAPKQHDKSAMNTTTTSSGSALQNSQSTVSGWQSYSSPPRTPLSTGCTLASAMQTSGESVDTPAPVAHQTNFDLICEVLKANPNGLRTEGIMQWLEEKRKDVLENGSREKVKASLQATLSAQANKKDPVIWKYRVEGSKVPGYVWSLSYTPVAATTSVSGPKIQSAVGDFATDLCRDSPSSIPASQPGHSYSRHAPSARSCSNRISASSMLHYSEPIPSNGEPPSDTGTNHASEHGTSEKESQDLYYGQVIITIHKLREQRAQVLQDLEQSNLNGNKSDSLEKELAQLQAHVLEQERLLLEQERLTANARVRVDDTRKALEVAFRNEENIALAKRKLSDIEEDITRSRKKLHID